MLGWLRRRFIASPPPCRLTAAQARAIAEAAFAQSSLYSSDGDGAFNYLGALGARMDDDRVEWLFTTPTTGSGVTVTVDDATGDADVRRWGLR